MLFTVINKEFFIIKSFIFIFILFFCNSFILFFLCFFLLESVNDLNFFSKLFSFSLLCQTEIFIICF